MDHIIQVEHTKYRIFEMVNGYMVVARRKDCQEVIH
jgi:hypothetical protein